MALAPDVWVDAEAFRSPGHELLEAVAAGEARALFISGDAGIGKSRLAEHVLATAAEDYGALTLVSRGYDLDEPLSYRPPRELRRQAAAAAAGQPRAEEVLRGALYLRRLLPGGDVPTSAAADP